MTFDWAAGLFDGEGSIGFYTKGPELSLEMTSKEGVEAFQEVMAVGTVIELRKRKGCQTVWRWKVNKREAIEVVLGLIGRRLVVKRAQAEVMKELIEWYRQRGSHKVYSEQDLCHLHEQMERLKRLKRQQKAGEEHGTALEME